MTAPLTVKGAGGVGLCVDEEGAGPTLVLAHGITAHRGLVVHGSGVLAREGNHVIRYDARGHGDSDPAPEHSYDYLNLADDLEAVVTARAREGRPVLVGHSMGAHTVVTHALRDPGRLAGLVVIGPVSVGEVPPDDVLARWDALADGLDRGIDGFLEAYEAQGMDPDWRETLLRIARERLERHRHPEAVAQAMREVPRAVPFDGMGALAALELPVLVVASHDVADPGHPYATSAAYAEALPDASLVSEQEGESPLAWQGGKLSREIAAFCAGEAVQERLGG